MSGFSLQFLLSPTHQSAFIFTRAEFLIKYQRLIRLFVRVLKPTIIRQCDTLIFSFKI